MGIMRIITSRDNEEDSAFDDESSAITELTTASKSDATNTYLMLRQVGK